jgi:signal transduction histidine kinase
MKKKSTVIIPFMNLIKNFSLLFLPLSVFNGLHIWAYQEFIRRDITEIYQPSLLNFILYISVVTGLSTAFVGFVHHLVWIGPVHKISKATQKFAQGDFSVRIPPPRKDSEKGFIGLIFDNFNSIAEELASLEIMKTSFIADVSHELKTPLAAIQNCATILQGDISEEKRREYAQIIYERAGRLVNLTSNILKLNKLEHQVIPPPPEPYALGERLRYCVFSFDELFRQKNIRLDTNISEVNIYLRCNIDTAEVIWNNLLSNALKFTDPGGNVFVSLREENGAAIISVQDTGCGMDETAKKHVFDKFYQADPSRSTEGNGLGLTLVKKTVELLGGTVTVESKPGMGSTFTVSLKM